MPFDRIELIAAFPAMRIREKYLHWVNRDYRLISANGSLTEWFGFPVREAAISSFLQSDPYNAHLLHSEAFETAEAELDNLMMDCLDVPEFLFDRWAALRDRLYDGLEPIDTILIEARSMHSTLLRDIDWPTIINE